MEKTIVADWIGKDKIGYWVGTFLSPENQQKVAELEARLQAALPGLLWTMPDISQHHITLFEIVMSLGAYSEHPDAIFERHRAAIDTELRAQLAGQKPITVTLDILEASPATIIVRGTDDGSFQRIRNAISGKQLLPEGTRTPPDIIHSSLARYLQAVDLEQVRSVVARHQLSLTQQVSEFEMAKILRPPMEHATLEVYKLPTSP